MSLVEQQKAILLLEDGTSFEGRAVGKIGITHGEICFNTGMTGYQEIFTDPSYFGQILIATNAHIGNYGIKDQETESESIKISGLVCKNFTDQYSRKVADHSIQEYFEAENLVAISDIDTRSIVRHIRNKGAMNAIISSDILNLTELKKIMPTVPKMEGLELASKVSTESPYFYGKEGALKKIAVLDFGVKKNILDCLVERDCYLQVFPARTTFNEMSEWQPDGYFLSNGPGDPGAMDYAVDTTEKILDSGMPLFGICLGHQILARALGIPTYKMHNGHRGINHPVKNMMSGLCEITSQNHGFGVPQSEVVKRKNQVDVTHVNLNDDTIEGIKVRGKNAFSVQFHPESSPGPHDSRYLFDQFVELL